ncbi:hypothetical protein [Neolewinella agarilytica]|uniref:hypothetical protein n=1 Tax=Neolewinella agarilytica TaxID=478744 RepID=UPI002355C5B1|nr:hypothetical protein [Neolewinella agarilytica]
MKIKFLSLALLLALSTVFYSCADGSDADRAADEMVAETKNTMADVGAELKGESNELAREFENIHQKIDVRMEELEAEMEDANEETKARLQKEWDRLDDYRAKLDARMQKVGDNMESGWKDFKGDVKKGWRDFSEKSEAFLEEVEDSLDSDNDLD